MQLSKIIIGLLATVLVVTGIFVFIADAVKEYAPTGLPSDYNASFVAISNSYADINDSLYRTNSSLQLDAGDNSNDFLGFIFNGVYKSAGIVTGSIGVTEVMMDAVIQSLGLGPYGTFLKVILSLMILTVIIVGIIMHFVTKSDRT